jgi:predicted hydrocarbon binding protein
MSATFPRLFGADPSSLPAETVISALPTCWGRFHDWGDIFVDVEPNRASVVMGGYSGSSDVCALVEAELERIVELTGAKEVAVSHVTCACRGDERCEFKLSWSSLG